MIHCISEYILHYVKIILHLLIVCVQYTNNSYIKNAAEFMLVDSIIQVWKKHIMCKRGCCQQWCVKEVSSFLPYLQRIS